ncbi:MAG: lytic transglycosylase domain-containing protein [Pseudomonadota bacterium]
MTRSKYPASTLPPLLATLLLGLGISMGGMGIAAAQNAASGSADTKKTGPKIYKYLKGGVPSFSDVPPAKIAYVVFSPSCYACNVNSNIDWHSTRLHVNEYVDEINLAARQYGVDPALVRAVIHAESGFNARARSQKGAMGLMQLMPGTARMLGVVDAHSPSHNIQGGAQYLAGLLAQFKNDVGLATAAYNAGPGAVQKYAGIPPYTETQVYVQRVKILHQRYKNPQQG